MPTLKRQYRPPVLRIKSAYRSVSITFTGVHRELKHRLERGILGGLIWIPVSRWYLERKHCGWRACSVLQQHQRAWAPPEYTYLNDLNDLIKNVCDSDCDSDAN